jgi:CRP-like cAMP-binding protein
MTLSHDEKVTALAKVPLFDGVSAESMARLVASTSEQDFAAGDFMLRQGQIGSGLFVILAGSARVLRGSDEVARLGPGDFVGELSVIDQIPRLASVQAAEPTRCLALASWELLGLLEHDSTLSLNLIRGLAARLRGSADHHH